ncbi:MAG: PAS domain S-box protein [Burkholderiales bacterium]|nr:PAS domain S-box protein [Burkholderiales bacterium]
MRDAAALAEWIIDQTSDALIYADRTGTIVRWNQASRRLFGYTADEALGGSLDIIIPEHLRAAHWSGFNAAIETGRTRLDGRPTLTRALRKDGRKLYVEMTFALVTNPDGAVVGSVAVARDVTERTEKERAARRAQEGVHSPPA